MTRRRKIACWRRCCRAVRKPSSWWGRPRPRMARDCCAVRAFRSSRPGKCRKAPIDGGRRLQQLRSRLRGRPLSGRPGPPKPRLYRRRRSARDPALEWLQRRRAGGRRQGAAPVDPRSQRLGQPGRAGGSARGVDAVFAANDANAIGFMSGLRMAGLLRNGPGVGTAGGCHRTGRPRNGPADRAEPVDAAGSRRRHRPHRGKADADPRRIAPCRSRL